MATRHVVVLGSNFAGPPVEVALTMAHWLDKNGIGGAEDITVFTPAKVIAEDVGENITDELLDLMGGMGFGYEAGVRDVERVTDGGIAFANGDEVEAELKILFPDWAPHDLMKPLPITDDVGFVVTDRRMQHPEYPNVYAAGDCAALTVPKLGALGHQQAEIIARDIAIDAGALDDEKAHDDFWPEVVCMGDFGGRKAFYIHSDVWYGGETEILKIGYLPYLMKLGFKQAYVSRGGKVPSWGVPMTEWLLETF